MLIYTNKRRLRQGPGSAMPPDARMRHDGCGGRAGRAELRSGIDGANGRPVRKIM